MIACNDAVHFRLGCFVEFPALGLIVDETDAVRANLIPGGWEILLHDTRSFRLKLRLCWRRISGIESASHHSQEFRPGTPL